MTAWPAATAASMRELRPVVSRDGVAGMGSWGVGARCFPAVGGEEEVDDVVFGFLLAL
jgi:hypothetical protein